jgi:YidC/Oxa1 family membrane protein insertase
MDKRMLLAIVVSLLILVLYQHFIGSRFQPVKAPAPAEQARVTPEPSAPEVVKEPTPMLPSAALTPELEQELESQKDYYLQDIEIETGLYRAVVTNKGGRIKSWVLRNYLDDKGDPLELVSPDSHLTDYYPLSIQLDDSQLTKRLNTSLYKVERTPYSQGQNQERLSLSYLDVSGLKVTKQITFYHDNYYMDINVKWENLTDKPQPLKYYLDWGYGLGPKPDVPSTYNHTGPSILIDGKLVKEKPKDIEGKLEHKGNISWVAFQDTYFAAMLIPKAITTEALITRQDETRISVGLAEPAVELGPGEIITQNFGLYVGPQKLDNLKAVGVGLEKIVDYGWFSFLAKPIMDILKFSHRYTGNYGVDIINLTILIKILFWPLTNSSFKSMKGMQKIQPKITALRQKYKNDPQRLNREIMEMYKQHKVNPVGGCMPMLLQIPVFFALYKALLISIELRHAPFFLWITDLSAAEPGWFGLWQAPSVWLNFRTLPILMGLSMFIQQKMTPSTGDPKQAKMMMLMPVFMTFIFYNMPAGLVIYFLLNNVLTIGQQHMINKKEA